MTMWLPDGWWIITEVTNKGVRFTAGANGLPEIESSAKFRSDREATSMARKALRSMSYENQDSGWSKFRCHARLPGQTKAFCGARIEDSPNTKHAYSEQCGNCLRIVESMPDPDEEDGFAVTVGLMEHITGWSVWEVLGWLNEKQAIPRRYDNAKRY